MTAEQVDNFITGLSGKSKNTCESYRRDLRQMCGYLAENPENTPAGYVDFLKETRKSSSVSRMMVSINAFYRYGITRGWFTENPVENIKPPRVTKNKRKSFTVDDSNYPKGYSSKAVRDRAMIGVVSDTKIKATGLVNLKLTDIKDLQLTQRTRDALEDYVYGSRDNLLDGKTSEFLFVNYDGSQLSRQGFWKIMKKYTIN